MDKETLSNYGWIVIAVLVLVVMIALAGPFGNFVAEAVKSTTQGLFDTNKNALDAAGITIDGQGFADGGSGDAENQGYFPISWNSMDVMGNTSFEWDGVSWVKISDDIPSNEEITKTAISYSYEGENIISNYEGIEQFGEVYYVYYDGMECFIVLTAGENAEMEATIPETGFYVIDVGSFGDDVDFVIDYASQDENTGDQENTGGQEEVTREEAGLYKTDGTFVPWDELIADGTIKLANGVLSTKYQLTTEIWMGMQMTVYRNFSSDALDGDLVVPAGEDITLAENAFNQCLKLRSVTFADNVIAINKWAFANCSSLVSIDLEKSTRLTTIKMQLVANCNILENIKLPSSITTIEEGAIASPNSLANFDIGHLTNLTTIGYNAISCCATSINIPASVQTIEAGAFIYCQNLKSINVDSANTNFCSVNGVLFTKDMKTLLCYPEAKSDAEYTIPNGVTTIAFKSIYRANKLKSLVIPSSVTIIGNNAFQFTTSLQEVTYLGTSSQWANISIGNNNTSITNIVNCIGE